jgi:uncharacterized protein
MDIEIEHDPTEERLNQLGVFSWPVWEKGVSDFPWHYDQRETCYLLAGEVTVTPQGGSPVKISAGDLATFPQGMACRWKITKAVKKHYEFG